MNKIFKFLIILILCLIPLNTLKSDYCHDFMLLDGFEQILKYGMDSSCHWWALTQPFTGKYRMIIDGVKSKSYDSITKPVFAPDGIRWAFFAIDASNQIYLVTDDSIKPISGLEPGKIIYSPNSEVLAYSYFEHDMEYFVIGDKNFRVLNRTSDVYLSQDGLRYAFVGQRGSGYVININGKESTLFERISPIGFWWDGKMMYIGTNGGHAQIYKENESISEVYKTITMTKINLYGTVMAAIAREFNNKYVTVMICDDYIEPIIGMQYEGIDKLVLHPTLPLIGYYAFNNGNNIIVQNGTEYGGGNETGNPHYTFDGSELYFIGCNTDCFISINGRQFPLHNNFPINQVFVMKPKSNTIAYTTSAALVLRNLENKDLFSGMMADTLSIPRYNWREERYETLGFINNKLYLMTCAKP